MGTCTYTCKQWHLACVGVFFSVFVSLLLLRHVCAQQAEVICLDKFQQQRRQCDALVIGQIE